MDSLKLYVKLGAVFLVITSGISHGETHGDSAKPSNRATTAEITFGKLNDYKKIQEVLKSDLTVPTKFNDEIFLVPQTKQQNALVKASEVKEPLETILGWRKSQEVCRNAGNQSASRVTDPFDRIMTTLHKGITEKDASGKLVGVDQGTLSHLFMKFWRYLKKKIASDAAKTAPDATDEEKKKAKEADEKTLESVAKLIKQFVPFEKLNKKVDPKRDFADSEIQLADRALKKEDLLKIKYDDVVRDFNAAESMLTDGSSKKICVADLSPQDGAAPEAASNPNLATAAGAAKPGNDKPGEKPTQTASHVTGFPGPGQTTTEPPGNGPGPQTGGGETTATGYGGGGGVPGTEEVGGGGNPDPNVGQTQNIGNGLNNDDLLAGQLDNERRALEDEIRRLQGELALTQQNQNQNNGLLADALGRIGDRNRSVTENPPVVEPQANTTFPSLGGGNGGGSGLPALTPPTDPNAGAVPPGALGQGGQPPLPQAPPPGPIMPPQPPPAPPEYKQPSPVVVQVPKNNDSGILQLLKDERDDRRKALEMASAQGRPGVTRANIYNGLPPRRPPMGLAMTGRPPGPMAPPTMGGLYRGAPRMFRGNGTGSLSRQFNRPFGVNVSPR